MIAVVGRGMAGTPGVAARVFSALVRRAHQRHRDRAGLLGAQHLVRGRGGRRRRRRRGASTPPSSSRRSAAGDRPSRGAPTSSCSASAGWAEPSPTMAAGAGEGRIRIVAALDRSGYVFDPRGVSRARLQRLAEGKDKGALLAGLGGRTASAPEALALDRRARRLAPGPRRRDGRGDGRPPRHRPRPGLRPRAREQEAARRLRRGLPSAARDGGGGRAAACATRPRSAPACP